MHDPEVIRARILRAGLLSMGRPAEAASFSPGMIRRTEDGKPFFPDLPDVYFSLSHSGDYIACAFSDREIGLDLQENRVPHGKYLRIARRFFTPAEYDALLTLSGEESAAPSSAQEQPSLFFHRLWSIKEAFLKYAGCGLKGGLDSFLPVPLPLENALEKGQIRILEKDSPLPPAQYRLIPAPEGYTMAVSAASLPDETIEVEILPCSGNCPRPL